MATLPGEKLSQQPQETTPASGDIMWLARAGTDYYIDWSDIVAAIGGGGGDFANGGEAGGADRTLGNTDAFALGFLTSGVERLKIQTGGNISIGGDFDLTALFVSDSTSNVMSVHHDTNTATNQATLGFALDNSANNPFNYAYVGAEIADNTSGSEGGTLILSNVSSGSTVERLRIDNDGLWTFGNTPSNDNAATQILVLDGSDRLRYRDASTLGGIYAGNGTVGAGGSATATFAAASNGNMIFSGSDVVNRLDMVNTSGTGIATIRSYNNDTNVRGVNMYAFGGGVTGWQTDWRDKAGIVTDLETPLFIASRSASSEQAIYFSQIASATTSASSSLANTTRMIIGTNGNIGVGMASGVVSSPADIMTAYLTNQSGLEGFSVRNDTGTIYASLYGTEQATSDDTGGELRLYGGSVQEEIRLSTVVGVDSYIDTQGNFGVGTTTPVTQMHIRKDNGGAQFRAESADSAGNVTLLLKSDTGTISGRSSPSFTIQASGNNVSNTVTRGHCVLEANFDTPGTTGSRMLFVSRCVTGGTTPNGSGGDFIWHERAQTTPAPFNSNSYNEFMRLDVSTGRLGIGTNAPGGILHTEATNPTFRHTNTNNADGNRARILMENTDGGNRVGLEMFSSSALDTYRGVTGNNVIASVALAGSVANMTDLVFMTQDNTTNDGDFVFGSLDTGGTAFTEEMRFDMSAQTLVFANMPTSDPGITGALWNNSGVVNVSP